MKLSVHLVTWNGAKYMPFLFDSLKKQTFKDWRLVILDNASSDDTVEKIKLEIGKWKLETGRGVEFVEGESNLGFAGGHNRLFKLTINNEQLASEYVSLLNQDMYLMSDCLEKLVEFMDNHPDAAAMSPRLMQWDFGSLTHPAPLGHPSQEGIEKSFTDQIDSLGLRVLRNRRVVERHTGEDWNKIGAQVLGCSSAEVFGVSGALPLYRASALDYIKFSDGTIFDESYHSYKEDVDLAYRLRSAGYKAYIVLDAVAYHDRSAAGPKDLSDSLAVENKKKQSEWVKYHSYKNHLMTLYKNEYWQNFLLDFPWILWYELKKFVYFLIFDRKVLLGLGEIWKMRRQLKSQKSKVKSLRKINWKDMREILKAH